jgi:hypothetical protein
MISFDDILNSEEYKSATPEARQQVEDMYAADFWTELTSQPDWEKLEPEQKDEYRSLFDKRFSQGVKVRESIEGDSRTFLGTVKDVGIAAAKGVVDSGAAVVGLADMATGGRVGKFLNDTTGYDPKATNEFLAEGYSDEQKVANQNVAEASGFGGKLKALAQNPSVAGIGIVESAPSMIGGAGIGRGVQKVLGSGGILAAGVGEGAITAGSIAEQTRQQNPDELLSGKQSLMAGGAGLGTSIFGVVGGRLASKFGFADIDSMLVAGGTDAVKGQGVTGVAKRIIGGGISEGVFEELPQSYQETIWQNAATGKPLLEGAAEAGAEGMVVGAFMGAGANALPTAKKPPEEEILAAPDLDTALDTFSKAVGAIDAKISGIDAAVQTPLREAQQTLTPQTVTPVSVDGVPNTNGQEFPQAEDVGTGNFPAGFGEDVTAESIAPQSGQTPGEISPEVPVEVPGQISGQTLDTPTQTLPPVGDITPSQPDGVDLQDDRIPPTMPLDEVEAEYGYSVSTEVKKARKAGRDITVSEAVAKASEAGLSEDQKRQMRVEEATANDLTQRQVQTLYYLRGKGKPVAIDTSNSDSKATEALVGLEEKGLVSRDENGDFVAVPLGAAKTTISTDATAPSKVTNPLVSTEDAGEVKSPLANKSPDASISESQSQSNVEGESLSAASTDQRTETRTLSGDVSSNEAQKEPWEMTTAEAIAFGKSVGEKKNERNRIANSLRASTGEYKDSEEYKKAERDFANARENVIGKFGLSSDNYNQGRGKDAQQKAEVLSDSQIKALHKTLVQKAITEGKQVPATVLADYPDLNNTPSASAEVASPPQGVPEIKSQETEPPPQQRLPEGKEVVTEKPLAEMSAAEIASEMSALREKKPRTLRQMFGSNATEEQAARHKAITNKHAADMAKLSRQHKIALERDNAAFHAKQEEDKKDETTTETLLTETGPREDTTPEREPVFTEKELSGLKVKVKGLLPNGKVGTYSEDAQKALADIDEEISLYDKIRNCVKA